MFYLFIYYYMYIVSVIHMWEWPTYVLSSAVFVFFSYVHLLYYRKKKVYMTNVASGQQCLNLPKN